MKPIKPIKIGIKEALDIQKSFDCLSVCSANKDVYLHNVLALAINRAQQNGCQISAPGRCLACICCDVLADLPEPEHPDQP
jgi:hypothetical protein